MKRFLAFLLAAMMLVGLLPAASAAGVNTKTTGDIWEQIDALEDARLNLNTRAANSMEKLPTASDFAALTYEVESLVRNWANFRTGTISRHGEFFFWEDTDGNAYGYSPRMRAQIREDAAMATADPEALAGVDTVDYSTRGGSAGSVNVATFQPYYGLDSSFQTTYATEGQRIAAATGGASTNYKTTAATIDAVASALENCGVVIFDSHGDTDYASGEDYVTRANTSYLCMQTNAGWTSADQQAVTGPYGTYYHCFNAGSYGNMKYYEVDGTGFANHMSKNGCNNLLWMAICLGMATDGLWKPLRSKGVEVVYGYSQSVSFSGDYDYEADFWDKMIDGDDVASAFAYMTRTYKWDPAYASNPSYDTIGEARYNFVAFPNVVSSEDAYQGHRTKNPTNSSAANSTAYNADYGACNLQTVNSAWTLFSQYAVTAVSNNTAWGTVSVNGKTITATPKSGYYVKDAEVISGTATISQNGNVFTVTPESDCTVRVNFAAKTPATIHFVTPDGVSCADVSTYVGDEFALPTPSGEPTADGHEYRFTGWTAAKLNDTTDRPAYEPAGKTVKATGDATYYALYTYTVAAGGASGAFTQLDVDPVVWDGEYILTYNGSVVLDASGNYTGTNLGSKDAAVAIADAGMSVSGGAIADPNDNYVYVIEASTVTSGAWTIRMKNSDDYIAYTGNTNSVTTTTDGTGKNAQWNLSFNGSTVSIQNANTVGTTQVRYLQYNTTSKQFRCYTNTMKNLTLFTGEAGTRYYTTELTTAAAHEHDCALAEYLAPKCTEDGHKAYLYCAGCGKMFSLEIWENDHVLTEITMSDVLLPATGHTPGAAVKENEVGATCENAGSYDEVVYCTTCNAELSRNHVDTTALGHDWGEPTYVWAEDYSLVTASHKCAHCNKVETEEVVPSSEVTVAPTVDAEGVLTYTATFTNPAFTVQTKTDTIPKLDPTDPCADGHDWDEPAYVWAEDYSSCTATRVCKNNAEHIETETAKAEGVETKPATEEEEGEIIYTARFENEAFGMREIAVVIPKLDPSQSQGFIDVADDAYYAEPVAWAVESGVTNGTSATTFSPDKTCTRGQVVTFLWRAKGSPEPSAENPFFDVTADAYYYKAVLWAVENKVTAGTSTTTFSPDKACTRGQVVTFLWRAEGEPEPVADGEAASFTDVKADAYYYEAVLWAVSEGITNGTGSGKFSPDRSCTRGQIVTFLFRDLAD